MRSRFQIQGNIALAPYTTLGVGGSARFFVSVKSAYELRWALAWAQKKEIPVRVLSGGSNVLIPDAGFDGLIIKNDIPGVEWHEPGDGRVNVTVGAGETWDDVVTEATLRDAWGIENLAGIPGAAGAAPVQNIGAYGAELSDVFAGASVYDTHTNEVQHFGNSACKFAYRDSIFKQMNGRYIVLDVTLHLQKRSAPNLTYTALHDACNDVSEHELTPAHIASVVRDIRTHKFPWRVEPNVGTAGSFFKNPIISTDTYNELQKQHGDVPAWEMADGYKIPAAWCIERAGFTRGYTEGPVGLWENHALVLVTYDGATADAVDAFATKVQTAVHKTLYVELEREVRTISN